MAVRRIISFSLALVCLFCLFCNSIYAIEFEPNCLNRQNEYEINSFIRTKETYINSSTYTKVTSAGNYGRSDIITINYLVDNSDVSQRVSYKIVEHMAFSEDRVYYLTLSENTSGSVRLYTVGNNFTVYAKYAVHFAHSGKIKTRISLYPSR